MAEEIRGSPCHKSVLLVRGKLNGKSSLARDEVVEPVAITRRVRRNPRDRFKAAAGPIITDAGVAQRNPEEVRLRPPGKHDLTEFVKIRIDGPVNQRSRIHLKPGQQLIDGHVRPDIAGRFTGKEHRIGCGNVAGQLTDTVGGAEERGH